MPKLWTGAETIAFCGTMIDRGWVTVAEEDGGVSGFLSRDSAEICALYVNPAAQGRGIGKTLVDAAKSAHPDLTLWTFQANVGAQRFYLREGFTETGRTDGVQNEEGLPDIAYQWRRPAEADK